jgi:hypothetical protein
MESNSGRQDRKPAINRLSYGMVGIQQPMCFCLVVIESPSPVKLLYNEDIHNLYPSSHLVRMIKSNRLRSSGYVARMAEWKMRTEIWSENLKRRDRAGDPNIHGDITKIDP